MEQEVIRHYDALIDEGNDPVTDPPPLRDYMNRWDGALFLDALCLNNQKSVLEIGVGTGRLAVRTAPLAGHFTGIDISPKTVERARQHLGFCKHATLICADFMTYSFSDRFDVIYSSLTFMHIKDKRAAVCKIADLLVPGGLFVLSIDKNPNPFIEYGSRHLRIYPDSPQEIRDCLLGRFTVSQQSETEFAYIFVSEKPF